MKGKWKWTLLLAEVTGLLLGAVSCTEAAEPCRGILYRVTGGKNEMMILGSIHVGNERMSRFGDALQQALKEADCFVFECDTASQEVSRHCGRCGGGAAAGRDAVQRKPMLLLEQTAQKCGIAMDRLNRLRPWAVTSALSSQAAAAELGTGSARSALRQGVEEPGAEIYREKAGTLSGNRTGTAGNHGWIQPCLAGRDGSQHLPADFVSRGKTGSTLSQWPEWWAEGEMEPFVQAYEAENDFARSRR